MRIGNWAISLCVTSLSNILTLSFFSGELAYADQALWSHKYFCENLEFFLSSTQLKLHGCHITLLPPRGNRISSATLAFNQILLFLLLYFDQANYWLNLYLLWNSTGWNLIKTLFQICSFDNCNMLNFKPNLPIKVIEDKMLTSELSDMKNLNITSLVKFQLSNPLCNQIKWATVVTQRGHSLNK